MLRELVGGHADDVMVLLERFDANHPRGVPHYYLSLLGTHPEADSCLHVARSPMTGPRVAAAAGQRPGSAYEAPATAASSQPTVYPWR
jgi:hypothetical protein